MIQSWKVINADNVQIDTLYCSTIEHARKKLEFKYGNASVFAQLKKGKQVRLEDIPLKVK